MAVASIDLRFAGSDAGDAARRLRTAVGRVVDDRGNLSVGGCSLSAMTRNPRPRSNNSSGTVYGEPLQELLAALAAVCGRATRHEDMLSLSLTLPPAAGGSLRRALLRSQAEILSRQADVIGARLPVSACQHCRESEAMLAVAEKLQRVARARGVIGTSITERAVLLGHLTSATPCRCAGC